MERTAAALAVRRARGVGRLTQRALANRAHDHQPNIAAIESGTRDAKFQTVTDLVHAAGASLCLLPTTTASVADVAEEIRRFLAHGEERSAYRSWLGLHDDLERSEPALRVALCVTPPVLVGESRYDALLAALVDFVLAGDGLPLPPWVDDDRRVAESDWWIEDLPATREAVRAATPPAFSKRRLYLDASELESV